MKKINILRFVTFAYLFLCAYLNAIPEVTIELPGLAQDMYGNFIATQGRSFDVVVTISQGDRDTGLSEVSGLNALRITSKEQEQQIKMMNGEFFSTITHTYRVIPEHLGTVTVGPAMVKKNNDTFQSDIVKITVVKPSDAQTKQVQGKKQSQNNNQEDPTVFCELESSKKEVFVGEPFEATLNIFSNGTILQTGIERPQFPGFWVKEITQVHGASINRDGIDYNLIQKKFILIPKQSGEKKINPIKVAYAAEIKRQQRKNTGLFPEDILADMLGGPRVKEFATTSNELSVNVKDLPKHTNHVDAVGMFEQFKASLDKTDILSNDTVIMKIELTGKGNFDQIADPKIVLPNGIKFYKSKTNVIEDLTHEYTGSTKVFEFILQPSISGTIEIQAQKFNYFDPDKQTYETLSTEPLILTIKQREGSNNVSPTKKLPEHSQEETPKDTSVEKNNDIAFIEEEAKITKQHNIELPWYLLILLLFVPIMLIAQPSLNHVKKLIPEKFLKKHTTQKMSQKINQDFVQLIQQKDAHRLYNFFLSLIAYKNNIESSMVTEQWITEQFPYLGWTEEKIAEFISFLHECASLHFVAARHEQQDIDQLLKKAQYWMLIINK